MGNLKMGSINVPSIWSIADLNYSERIGLWALINKENKNMKDGGKWFYVTVEEIEMDFGLSPRTFSRCVKKLSTLGYINVLQEKGRVSHFQINWDAIEEADKEWRERKTQIKEAKTMSCYSNVIEMKPAVQEEKLVVNFQKEEDRDLEEAETIDYGTIENHPEEYDDIVDIISRIFVRNKYYTSKIMSDIFEYTASHKDYEEAIQVYTRQYADECRKDGMLKEGFADEASEPVEGPADNALHELFKKYQDEDEITVWSPILNEEIDGVAIIDSYGSCTEVDNLFQEWKKAQ